MSLESVRAWLAANAPDLLMIEVEGSTATVDTAAEALGVEPGRIAKTLAVRAGDQLFLVVARGDARLDNPSARTNSAPALECSVRKRRLRLRVTRLVASAPLG